MPTTRPTRTVNPVPATGTCGYLDHDLTGGCDRPAVATFFCSGPFGPFVREVCETHRTDVETETGSIYLPSYREWWSGTGDDCAALRHFDHERGDEGCPGCVVSLLLPAIRDAYYSTEDPTLGEAIYDLSDVYGEVGFVPSQGYDWSGIRDSSPAAVGRMWQRIEDRRLGIDVLYA